MFEIFEINETNDFVENINISELFHFYDYSFDFSQKTVRSLNDSESSEIYQFFFAQYNEFQHKEHFYIKAIRNLVKQRDFLSLVNQYDNNLLDDNQFSNEIEFYPEKYVIEVDENLDVEKYHTLSNIIEKLNIELHESDISDMFSINIFNKKTFFKT